MLSARLTLDYYEAV